MKPLAILLSILCLTLGALTLPALAQGEGGSGLRMSSEQERALYQSLVNRRVQAAPAGTSFEVGTMLPRNVRLYSVPRRAEPREVRRYRYTVSERRVVLVDPEKRQIVRVIGVAF